MFDGQNAFSEKFRKLLNLLYPRAQINVINAGIRSEHSLYSEEIATFGEEDVYNQHDAEGFINLFGLPVKVKALLENKEIR